MKDYLIDTNVFFSIFSGNALLKDYIENLDPFIETTVFVECIQGSKSKQEKNLIKKYLSRFELINFTPDVSKRTISLIDSYSGSHGLMLPDAQIAAACIENSLTLITYNVVDFKFIDGLNWKRPKF